MLYKLFLDKIQTFSTVNKSYHINPYEVINYLYSLSFIKLVGQNKEKEGAYKRERGIKTFFLQKNGLLERGS